MNKLLKNDVLDNLKGVQDPSQNNNIVDLGFVKNIEIKGENLFVTLEVPSHRGPSMEPIRKLAEVSLKKVDATAHRPQSSYPHTTSHSQDDGHHEMASHIGLPLVECELLCAFGSLRTKVARPQRHGSIA